MHLHCDALVKEPLHRRVFSGKKGKEKEREIGLGYYQ
jgi:hypothetical protein